eukprot:CAMPEP_0174729978 /NCGR_PEP_ID=MMETSP1094-20130205/54680_1 /TAXON_ID=156173 /ORGANISM="Chrysochromulina brevifilum, Strain UTEX LB 985" /LENGTH=45 /DNA_ID= /DNA_START= /DNA_END= /DNA_ORIENTATION=
MPTIKRVRVTCRVHGAGCRVQGAGRRVQSAGCMDRQGTAEQQLTI